MQFSTARALANKIGYAKLVEYLVRSVVCRIAGCHITFRLPHMASAAEIRPRTSDMQVFHDIFIWDEYGFLKPSDAPIRILDIGANVGYSSLWFAGHYPECTLTAVELMHSNFKQLVHNTTFLGGRIKRIEAAVWSHNDGVSIADDTFRDGDAWSHHASEAKDGKCLVPSITMFELMQKHAMPRINICKIDIEGAEFELFADGHRDWVNRCDVILLEIHEDLATFDIVAAMHADGFHSFTAHELTIFYQDADVAKRFIRDEFLVDAKHVAMLSVAA